MNENLIAILGLIIGLLGFILTYYYRFYYYKASRASSEEEKFIIDFLTMLRESQINSTYYLLRKEPSKDLVYSTQYGFFQYVNSLPFSRRIARESRKLSIIAKKSMFDRSFKEFYNHPYLPEKLKSLLHCIDVQKLNNKIPILRKDLEKRRESFVLLDDKLDQNIIVGIGYCMHKYHFIRESEYFYLDHEGKPMTLREFDKRMQMINKFIKNWLRNRKLLHLYKKEELHSTKFAKKSLNILLDLHKQIQALPGMDFIRSKTKMYDL